MVKYLVLISVLLPLPLAAEPDLCSHDPAKVAPGSCGCGVPEQDKNRNGIPDCLPSLDLDQQLATLSSQLLGIKTGRSGPSGDFGIRKARRIARGSAALGRFWDGIVAPVTFSGSNQVASAEAFGDAIERLKALTKHPAKFSAKKKSAALMVLAELRALRTA